jgi:hypothetical protein
MAESLVLDPLHWFYDVDSMIYSPEYTNTGGFLVFKVGGPKGTCNTHNTMWNILYHGNNHLNSIQSPKTFPRPSQHKTDMDRYQAYMQNALEDYQDNFANLLFCPILMKLYSSLQHQLNLGNHRLNHAIDCCASFSRWRSGHF